MRNLILCASLLLLFSPSARADDDEKPVSMDSSAFNHGDNVDIEVLCYGTAVRVEKEDSAAK